MGRILITGGSGYLGRHLVPLAAKRHDVCYTFHSYNPLDSQHARQLDIRDEEAVLRLVTDWRPEAIIHLAGSNRSADMDTVIRRGSFNLCQAARATGARLVHLSTDVLFDGRAGPYRESDPPSPVHAYGRAKAAAEEYVARHTDHVIVRTSLIYGLEIIDHSTDWVITTLDSGQSVTLFDNQLRNPVWANTLALACLELVAADHRGVLHVAGNQEMTRAEFGLKLLDWWGVTNRGNLRIGPSSGPWPLDCRLEISMAQELLSTPLLGMDEVLANYTRT